MQRAPRIREFIAENFLFGPVDQVRDDESFLESGILDSTGVLQLVDFLEEAYGFKMENDEVTPDNLDSIAKITTYLERKFDSARDGAFAGLQPAETGGRI